MNCYLQVISIMLNCNDVCIFVTYSSLWVIFHISNFLARSDWAYYLNPISNHSKCCDCSD